jgi:hypothetical protein
VAEVAQQPPQPGRPTCTTVVVGDDEDARPDSHPGRRGCERLGGGQRVPALALHRQVGELVDPEEGRARNVRFEVLLATGLDPREVVPAVDEPIVDQ